MLNVQPQIYAPRTGPQSFPVAGMPFQFPQAAIGMVPTIPVAVVHPRVPLAHQGTLQAGQRLKIGEYEVVVERYLAEGGYAHVYLVNTSSPIKGETRHVLKRIACASDEHLREVGMEVQVMKLLRGHPNIVQLHSATSEPQADGSSVVLILMEFCAGGGIIDYMNRRLRERLTEQEILQIFVDVCEGVASMHALKPPLLHRDLKIENILQSSSTLYKLCDFGSAAAVSAPPTNLVQMRLLEADVNKHTTLQYRAPEMVDVTQRRPIDTKSDVWALGVLLYKLCYYTTPFEAHGPVAILTASYKIPSYPVYSQEMNGLIGRMLQERGANRPSVFELLEEVHRMQGTRSQFHYNISAPPPLSPTKPLKTAALRSAPLSSSLTAAITARDQILSSLTPLDSLRTHISGPGARSSPATGRNGGNILGDTQQAERSRQAGLRAAMRGPGGEGKISPAFTPATTSPASQHPQLPFGEGQHKPAVATKPSYVSTRIGQLGQAAGGMTPLTSPPAQERPSPAPKPSLAPKPAVRLSSIAVPSPSTSSSLSLVSPPPSSTAPLLQSQPRTPAFRSPRQAQQDLEPFSSAENRFPSIDELDAAFSPPTAAAGRSKPFLDVSPTKTTHGETKGVETPWLTKKGASPTKLAAGGQVRLEPVSSRSTGVRDTSVPKGGMLSPPSTATAPSLPTRPSMVGRPVSAEPAVAIRSVQRKPAPTLAATPASRNDVGAKAAMPERTNPPMKKLEADFAKPRKRKSKRSSSGTIADDEHAPLALGGPKPLNESKPPEKRPTKPKDWLTGSFDADDPTLAAPAAPSKPSVAAKPTELKSNSSTAAPVLAQQTSEASMASLRQFVRSPEPVKASLSSPTEAGMRRTSPFKRRSVAVAQSASNPSASAGRTDGEPPKLPTRPQSGVFSPPSLKATDTPMANEKPSFLRNVEKPAPASTKVDTSYRKPPPTLTDNWSPIEIRHRRKESSDDDGGPEDAKGGAIRTLRRQFEQPKPDPPKPAGLKPVAGKPAVLALSKEPDVSKTNVPVAPDSPTKIFAARFPDLAGLDAQASHTEEKPRRSPLPSPNIMDEANEEMSAVPARPSYFLNRNGQQSNPGATPPSTTSSSRPRPQSMFLSSSMMQTMGSLQPPPDTSTVAAERRSTRRGSISDMVSKYEALNSSTVSKPAPKSPSKESLPAEKITENVLPPTILPAAVSKNPASISSLTPLRSEATTEVTKESAISLPASGANAALGRRRTLANTSIGGIGSIHGPPKAHVGLPGLAKLSSVPERAPLMPLRQNSETIGDYKPRALPGLAKPPSPTKQSSFLSTPTNSPQQIKRVPSPAQAGLPMRPISPIGMPLPAPKSAAVPEPAPVILQPVELSPPTPSIVSPTPRRANPSPGPPSATSDGVDTTFQGVNKLVAQWQKRAEEGTQPAKNNVNVDKKVPAWQKLR